MKAILTILAIVAVALVIGTDPWWTDTLAGISMLLLLLAVVGGLCWLDGYQRGKS